MSSSDKSLIQQILTLIRPLLSPETQIFLFGSRARGDHTIYSDYDIGIQGPSPLSRQLIMRLKRQVDNIPANIDIVDFASASPSFVAIAGQHRIVL